MVFLKRVAPVLAAALLLLAFITLTSDFLIPGSVFAQAAPPGGAPPAPKFGELFGRMLPMFIVVFFIFYFLVMRPQAQKLKSQNQMLQSLKRGDQVVTSSGMFGKISSVDKDHVLIEVASNVRIKFEPSHITRRVEKQEGEKSAAA